MDIDFAQIQAEAEGIKQKLEALQFKRAMLNLQQLAHESALALIAASDIDVSPRVLH